MTATLQASETITLELSGTFDIANARNRIRQIISSHRFPTLLGARASAATTTIAEIALFRSNVPNAGLKLTIAVIEDQDRAGIEFHFNAPITKNISKRFVVAEWQLERACDEIEIRNTGADDQIVMRIWIKRRAV